MSSKSFKKKPSRKRSSSKFASSMASFKYLYLRKFFILVSIILLACVILVFGVSSNTWNEISSDSNSLKFDGYEIVNEFPHDPRAFTQGLVYAGNDTLFESTGLYRQSSVRKVALRTGKVEILHKMADSYFGEGLTLLGERLLQVTWLTQIGFIYDRKNLQKLERFTHQMEDGWGLATDGKILYGSDGTSTLYQIDPQTLKVTRKHVIKFNGQDVRYLNELEYINGEIWANVWQTDCIARISPNNGTMLGWILLHTLRVLTF
ncbi:glutaminyl-peptide cyclotransferase-like isoform X3 [Durio zibethinus]|uniref:Glutaminyl-peptide cyclotransferase-like isoform X3 n=1 Tax=Durio zibethinus TaxID=66656 RepID=A0A6P5X8G6_DURZI|nr:glutaminyl-peptide cyclotransferase-like isoform X3 [Durio zibethinus]XP_022724121.1 glutaminyl-peptide cyclotransferase-like isoform X3 [Durio zibethinus]